MQNILKQSSWLLGGQAVGRGIGFFYTIFLARSLGVEDFGLYSAALAYYSLFMALADFGFNRFLVREIAKDKLSAPALLWNIVMLRLTLTAVLFAIFALVLYWLDPDKMRISLTLLATLAILPQAVALTFDAVFVGLQKLQFSALSLFISGLFTAVIGLFLVERGFGPMGAVNALILGQIIYGLVLLTFLYQNKALSLSAVSLPVIKKAVSGSLPYGLLGILGLVYFKIDTVLLSYLKGNFETGIYGVAYKFLEAVIFIPGSFSAALFPALAKLHGNNFPEMRKIYFKSLKLMFGLGIILLLAYFLILPEIIKLFMPQFLPATEAVKILALSIPFIFAATPGVAILLSSDKYLKTVIFLSFFTVAFNIVLNLYFIPRFGFKAAAWITVASDILSFMIFYFLITRKIFAHEKS